MNLSFKLPDPAICKTRHDFADYWKCIGEKSSIPNHCPHLRKMGLNHYCTHAENWSFANEESVEKSENDL